MQRRSDELPILHPGAAGFDVGASEFFVTVSADRAHNLSASLGELTVTEPLPYFFP
jgi:hypothetical protein